MALSLQESLNRSCRLCAEEQEVTIMLFSEQAEAMLLNNKLNQYLKISIDRDDNLPKNVCLKCCSKLNNISEFVENVEKAQMILHNRTSLLEQLQGKPETTQTMENENVEQEVIVENCESEDQDDNSITQMEISVDPMMVLQNCEELTIKEECENNVDDITFLRGADGENVTIKLIRSGNDPLGPLKLVDESHSNDNDSDASKPFPCITCKRKFTTDLALKSHQWIHSTEEMNRKEFQCHTCDQTFDYRTDLLAHMKKHKTKTICKVCSRTFRSVTNLEIHLKKHMTPFKTHVCKICGRAYNNFSNLKTHSVTHSDVRPFECPHCKKTFKRNQDLKFHSNQHTGEKPYKCPFCDKSFASSGNCYSHRNRMHPGLLLEHKATRGRPRNIVAPRETQFQPKITIPPLVSVKGVDKYKCNICNHSFMKRDNYMCHMFQHTGEKPFHCEYCTEKFVTRKGLLIHHDKWHATKERPLIPETSDE